MYIWDFVIPFASLDWAMGRMSKFLIGFTNLCSSLNGKQHYM